MRLTLAPILATACLMLGCGGTEQPSDVLSGDNQNTQTVKPAPKPIKPKFNAEAFADLYRAAKTIEGSSEVGLTKSRLEDELRKFATELTIAKDQIESDEEREIYELYGDAFQIYKDSIVLWDAKSRNKRRSEKFQEFALSAARSKDEKELDNWARRSVLLDNGYILLTQYEGEELAETFQRQEIKVEYQITIVDEMFMSPNSIQMLWSKAVAKVGQAHALTRKHQE